VAAEHHAGVGSSLAESIPSMRSRVTLQPPLSGDLTRLAFSPEAKYVLGQDPVNITVLSVQPFGPLFQVRAEAAAPAAFSPDSTMLVFSNATCRIMERLQIIDPSSGETLFGKAKFGASCELSLQPEPRDNPTGPNCWEMLVRRQFSSPRWNLSFGLPSDCARIGGRLEYLGPQGH
jgi:hypothetical protein